MKKVIYIFVALLAFVSGVFVFYIRPLFIIVPLYDLRENISHYESLKVKVRGDFEVTNGESSYLYGIQDYKNDCSDDCVSYKGLELPKEIEEENIKFIKELAEKNSTLGKTDFRQGMYMAKVEVTGYVEERYSVGFDMSYFVIKVVEIKQISPIKFITVQEMVNTK